MKLGIDRSKLGKELKKARAEKPEKTKPAGFWPSTGHLKKDYRPVSPRF